MSPRARRAFDTCVSLPASRSVFLSLHRFSFLRDCTLRMSGRRQWCPVSFLSFLGFPVFHRRVGEIKLIVLLGRAPPEIANTAQASDRGLYPRVTLMCCYFLHTLHTSGRRFSE